MRLRKDDVSFSVSEIHFAHDEQFERERILNEPVSNAIAEEKEKQLYRKKRPKHNNNNKSADNLTGRQGFKGG